MVSFLGQLEVVAACDTQRAGRAEQAFIAAVASAPQGGVIGFVEGVFQPQGDVPLTLVEVPRRPVDKLTTA